MKRILNLFLTFLILSPFLSAQVVDESGQVLDTTNIYKERKDSLDAAVFVSRQAGNYLSKTKDIRTEVITAGGLCKMACCNLAESFENSASVTVGYSDAVTGARQIRLLGLSGIYTQMLDENRPVMRGLSAPFGLSYVPGQWLESIQIAKGSSSVINGVESITGQINMEHRKPTDEKPLFINAAVMSDTKMDFNIASSLQLNEDWSTVILGHVSGNVLSHDLNNDGFLDEPKMLQFNLANRWLYFAPTGLQVRFGVRAIQDHRLGGQVLTNEAGEKLYYNYKSYSSLFPEPDEFDPWGSDITNRSIDAYLKVGLPLDDHNSQSIAMVLDYNYQMMDAYFGSTLYDAGQHSAFANFLYQKEINEAHKFTLGLSALLDIYDEDFSRTLTGIPQPQTFAGVTKLGSAGIFGEYTFKAGDKFTFIGGLRGDYYNAVANGKFKLSPRLNLKYAPIEEIVIRANGGRGLRYANPLIDNIGVFSTGKRFEGLYKQHLLEDAWTFGGNLTYYMPFGASSNTYFSFDYFRTQFIQQMIVDYEFANDPTQINFYALDSGRSYTDNFQIDFNIDPIERFNINATFRYTNAKQEMAGRGLVEKPMTSRYKGVLNLQYATNLNKWIFDFTASINGPARVYDFMEGMSGIKERHGKYYSPAYPLLFFQITKRFKGVDIYAGVENLTNFRQKDVVIDSDNPRSATFDASAIWGPLMGIKGHIGVRFTLWKI